MNSHTHHPTVDTLQKQVATARTTLALPQGLVLAEPSTELFERASSLTSHVPELRAEQYRLEYLADIHHHAEVCGDHLTQGDLDRLSSAWGSWLAASGRCASTFITGASNFPTRRARKASDSADKRYQELVDVRKRIIKRCARDAKATEVEAAGGPLAVLRQEITDLEVWREMAKAANCIIRAKPRNECTEVKIERLMDIGVKLPQAEALFVKDFGGRYGFADYELTNSLAQLKSKRARLVELERRDADAIKSDDRTVYGDVTVIVSYADDRIRIRHANKPPADIRAALKASGWRWSRLNGAWQRQLTDTARLSAEELLGIDLGA